MYTQTHTCSFSMLWSMFGKKADMSKFSEKESEDRPASPILSTKQKQEQVKANIHLVVAHGMQHQNLNWRPEHCFHWNVSSETKAEMSDTGCAHDRLRYQICSKINHRQQHDARTPLIEVPLACCWNWGWLMHNNWDTRCQPGEQLN